MLFKGMGLTRIVHGGVQRLRLPTPPLQGASQSQLLWPLAIALAQQLSYIALDPTMRVPLKATAWLLEECHATLDLYLRMLGAWVDLFRATAKRLLLACTAGTIDGFRRRLRVDGFC